MWIISTADVTFELFHNVETFRGQRTNIPEFSQSVLRLAQRSNSATHESLLGAKLESFMTRWWRTGLSAKN